MVGASGLASERPLIPEHFTTALVGGGPRFKFMVTRFLVLRLDL